LPVPELPPVPRIDEPPVPPVDEPLIPPINEIVSTVTGVVSDPSSAPYVATNTAVDTAEKVTGVVGTCVTQGVGPCLPKPPGG
jgi:hypothetical protein